jgi:arsenite methyltransferase
VKNYIRKYYTGIYGKNHDQGLPIARGKSLAAELGYPPRLLEALPDDLWEDFLPCGNVLPFIRPKIGEAILNLGCGAGIDSFALRYLGFEKCNAMNLDMVLPVMLKASRFADRLYQKREFDWICGDGENLPLLTDSVDWVVLNGVFNLFTDKTGVVEELRRVLHRSGTVVGADLCRKTDLPDYFASEPAAWAWCMSGALTEQELEAVFQAGGFSRVEIIPEKMDELFDRTIFVFRKTG